MKFCNLKIAKLSTISLQKSTGERREIHEKGKAVFAGTIRGPAARMEELEQKIKRIDERNTTMQLMYTQLVEKVAEMDRYL